MNKSQLYFIGKAAGANAALDYFTANDAVYPRLSKASAVSRNSHPLVGFPESQEAFVDFPGVLPDSGIVTVELLWATTVVLGNVLWALSWERDNPTFGPPQENLDINWFAPSKTVLSPAPSASGLLRQASITFTPAEMGGILPGEAYRLRAYRNAGVGPDDLVATAQLFRVILKPA
jgi:hypothetical protein